MGAGLRYYIIIWKQFDFHLQIWKLMCVYLNELLYARLLFSITKKSLFNKNSLVKITQIHTLLSECSILFFNYSEVTKFFDQQFPLVSSFYWKLFLRQFLRHADYIIVSGYPYSHSALNKNVKSSLKCVI